MSLKNAIEALKNKDFKAARDIMAGLDHAMFDIPHYLTQGLAELSVQDWSGALATFTEATGRFKTHALFWLNRGIAEEKLSQFDAAIESQEKSIALNPALGEAFGNLSNLYRYKKDFAKAEIMARQALVLGAPAGEALNCLGLALSLRGKFEEARKTFDEAHAAAPDNAAILANRANLEADDLQFDAAWRFFAEARAIEDKPVFQHDEALVRLLTGDYEKGWALFEARLDLPGALRLHPDCPRWKGEDLTGKKLLVLAEQGFGDVIQFSRYQKFLGDAEMVWAVPQNLVRILSANLRGAVMDEKGALPPCDYYVPVLSLPFATKQVQPLGLDSYFTAPQTPVLPAGKRRRKIGLVWAGSRTHNRDHERSVPLKVLAPFVNEMPADFYAPFTGDALDEIGDLPITRLDHLITDFADTAALLAQMDALISVDTAVAHLAASLGIKTLVLLPRTPDWRWGVAGEKTPWYSTMTLARQERCGDWEGLIENLLESGF